MEMLSGDTLAPHADPSPAMAPHGCPMEDFGVSIDDVVCVIEGSPWCCLELLPSLSSLGIVIGGGIGVDIEELPNMIKKRRNIQIRSVEPRFIIFNKA